MLMHICKPRMKRNSLPPKMGNSNISYRPAVPLQQTDLSSPSSLFASLVFLKKN